MTETDLDFENRVINVDHQLLRSAETGYYIEKPKTQSSIRQIPMSEKVYEALGSVLENRKGTKQIAIDGYSNFLFLNRDGCPKTNVNYAAMFRGLTKKYNFLRYSFAVSILGYKTEGKTIAYKKW